MSERPLGLVMVILLIAGAIFYLSSLKPEKETTKDQASDQSITMNKEEKSKIYPEAKELLKPSGFINTDPITLKEFIGKKVILVDFWTYSCINCQRTTPYLNAWWEKYKDKGLLIVGVHTPEFEFEKKYENVAAAVKKFGIEYPVVQDNDYTIWNAYANRYWPRKYLIDIDGYIVYDHIGEGGYEETERAIQKALTESMQTLGIKGGLDKEIAQPADAPKVYFAKVKSPETYFGAYRNKNFASGQNGMVGAQTFVEPTNIEENNLYLVGQWNIQNEYAENKNSNAKIIFKYNSSKVYLVASADKPVRIKIRRDGEPLKTGVAGLDVDKDGYTTVAEDRLYKLIEDTNYGEHTLEIIIESPGLKAFAFTFG